ncbi:hypothetical protein B0H19DRAFT_285093 [Mycena capillaripes]|nr:hypothetical protein B0H19DRAFT_285093 [Mycena capillaripes]
MDQEPPASPDYFKHYEAPDPALYRSPSQPSQHLGAPPSPSPQRSSNTLISSESLAQHQIGSSSQPSAQVGQHQFGMLLPWASFNLHLGFQFLIFQLSQPTIVRIQIDFQRKKKKINTNHIMALGDW